MIIKKIQKIQKNVEKEIQITTSTQEESPISDEEKTEIIEETGKQGDYDLYEINKAVYLTD